MTKEEFIKAREQRVKDLIKEINLTEIKELLGDEAFNRLEKLDNYHKIFNHNNGSDGTWVYELNLKNGTIGTSCSIADGKNITLPDENFNKKFFDYCVKIKII